MLEREKSPYRVEYKDMDLRVVCDNIYTSDYTVGGRSQRKV